MTADPLHETTPVASTRPPRRWAVVRDPSAQARSTVGGVMVWQLVANGVGFLMVALYVMVLFPSGSSSAFRTTMQVFTAYVATIVLVASPVNWWLLRRAVRWVGEGTDPTPAQRRLLFRLPLFQTLPALVWWGAGALMYGLINDGSRRVSIGICFAAVVTCAGLYLLLESHFRPVFALALRTSDLPENRRDLLPRLMLTWALGSGVPIALLGVAPLLDEHFDWKRMPWIAAFAILGGGAVTAVGAFSVARPLNRVRQALRDVERGHLDFELPVDDLGELGRLTVGVNDLVAGLRERERLREQFGRQVGSGAFAVAEGTDNALDTVGVLRTVTVLFVDLEGFTRFSEGRSPAEVVDMLNRFFGVVVTAVNREGGWVNKFEGDAALCIFGAPEPDPLHAQRALAAAARMQNDLANEDLGGARLGAGIGVASGSVIAGFLGTPERYEYTVIGDCVNLASRLCDLAKTVDGRALVSEDAFEAAGQPEGWTQRPSTRIRGLSESVNVYELDAARSKRSLRGRSS